MQFENSKIIWHFNSFGKIDQYVVRSNDGSTSSIPIDSGNTDYLRIEEYIKLNHIKPEYNLEWVQQVTDGYHNLLFYRTNMGDFVDSDANAITSEIKQKIQSNTIEMRESEIEFQIKSIEVNIFLPRAFRLNAVGSTPIDSFKLQQVFELNEIEIELLQKIEDNFFAQNEWIKDQFRSTDGLVIRCILDSSNAKQIYQWAKRHLDKETIEMLEKLSNIDFELHKRKKSRGIRTQWYFEWLNLQQYIWVPILHITNQMIWMINQQSHRKSMSQISKDEVREIACIKAYDFNNNSYLWPLSKLHDSQISLFPEELNWSHTPFSIATNKIRFLYDQSLYFEAIIVAQAIFESIVNGMFNANVTKQIFGREELRWEEKYKYLREYFNEELHESSILKALLNGGFKEIYVLRNSFAHDYVVHKPEYKFEIEAYKTIGELLKCFTQPWENNLFGIEIHSMYLKRDEFLRYIGTLKKDNNNLN